MDKMWLLGRRKIARRNDSKRALIEKNNNDIHGGNNQACNIYVNPLAQNTFNTHREQSLQAEEEITLPELAALLGVVPGANTSEDGPCYPIRLEPSSASPHPTESVVLLVQRSVSQHFPKPPADLDQNLQQHLFSVQETVRAELVKLGPQLKTISLTKCLTDCYHRQTIDHLNDLLKNISTAKNSFVLMNWLLCTYLRQELLDHPDLKEMDPITTVDLLLFTEFVEKAKDKLLENVTKEVRRCLVNILQIQESQNVYDREENYVQVYLDTIQCIESMPQEAQKISSKLSDLVREVCFRELLTFLRRYMDEQTEILERKAKMDKPETIHFFKTLNTCKGLKEHVKTKGQGIKPSLLQETVATLENVEAYTMKLLMGIVADFAEKHLKKYFKTSNREFFSLLDTVKTHFPKLLCSQDIQKMVMDEAYELIAHIYLKHLVRSSQRKLNKHWNLNVGKTVAQNAELLHNTISDLAPGVQPWNLMLRKVPELLDCESMDTVKIEVASMQMECRTWSKDMELLPALLQWKGLSKSEVREVLDAIPGYQPRPRPEPWCCCLTCW